MKLRKALDKAQKIRDGEDLLKKSKTEDKIIDDQKGWQAPTYFGSQLIEPDPKIMEAKRCVCMFPDSLEIDYYKILRSQIQQAFVQNNWSTLMVTSALPGEGKTLSSINLSLTFAKLYQQTILLVDCDLKKRHVHQYLGIPNSLGLVDYLIDNKPLNDIIVWPGIDKMTVISGGKMLLDSSEILGSPRMESLVNEMKERYEDRYIIFDVPPILTCADAISFAPLVDCIIMVVEEGKTSMQDVQKALEMIPKEKFVGFVLNKQQYPSKANMDICKTKN